jgi:hypothetical protein
LIPDVVLGAGEAMRRREFIAFVGCTTAAWSLAVRAEQSAMPVIGFLNSASPQPFANYVSGFRIDAHYNLAIEFQDQAQYTVRRQVLRPKIYREVPA